MIQKMAQNSTEYLYAGKNLPDLELKRQREKGNSINLFTLRLASGLAVWLYGLQDSWQADYLTGGLAVWIACLLNGWLEGWVDGWVGGWREGRMHGLPGWMDGCVWGCGYNANTSQLILKLKGKIKIIIEPQISHMTYILLKVSGICI